MYLTIHRVYSEGIGGVFINGGKIRESQGPSDFTKTKSITHNRHRIICRQAPPSFSPTFLIWAFTFVSPIMHKFGSSPIYDIENFIESTFLIGGHRVHIFSRFMLR